MIRYCPSLPLRKTAPFGKKDTLLSEVQFIHKPNSLTQNTKSFKTNKEGKRRRVRRRNATMTGAQEAITEDEITGTQIPDRQPRPKNACASSMIISRTRF